jgi:hypothetical protein
MVKVIDSNNNPHFFIAIRTSANSNRDVKYYRVSGDSATDLTSSGAISLYATGLNPYYYALDGRGRLYAITAANTVSVFNIDGTSAGTATVTGVAGFLGLADRALAKTGTNVYQITTTGSAATAVDKGTALYTVVNNCTHTDTRSVDGAGTNFVRCVYVGGGNTYLYSLTYDSNIGLYGSANHNFGGVTFNNVLWAPNKALVSVGIGPTIYLCNTTTTPSISCSATDLLDLNPTDIGKYLKFNGNNVFYLSGTSPKVGDIFGTQTTLPIAVSSPSGGNAS